MLADVIEVQHLEGYTIRVVFEDGLHGVIDLRDCAHDGGIFAPLEDVDFFAKCQVNRKTGTIDWPNGADLAPEFLYERLKEQYSYSEQKS